MEGKGRGDTRRLLNEGGKRQIARNSCNFVLLYLNLSDVTLALVSLISFYTLHWFGIPPWMLLDDPLVKEKKESGTLNVDG